MAQYKLKKEYQGKGLVTTFSKPIPNVGFSIVWDTATPEQIEQAYLFLGADFALVEKVTETK